MALSKLFSTLSALLIAANFGLASGAAAFTWANCNTLTPDASGKLSGSVECAGNTSGGAANPGLSDFNGLFGIDGWVEIAKESSSTGGANLDAAGVTFLSDNNNFSGSWSITQSVLNLYTTIAIIMKDGNMAPAPTIAYKVDASSFSGIDFAGTWSTPWVNIHGKENNSLSNVRFIGSGPATPIPLPAAGWLLISVFGGLGLANHMRRKRSSA